MSVQPIPEGRHSITASLNIKGAAKAIEFYKKTFGATELFSLKSPEGLTMHAEMQIGDSVFCLSEEMPEIHAVSPLSVGGCPTLLRLYVKDCDAVFQQASDAGCEVLMPMENQFWGDRVGGVRDPFGYRWNIATHVEDITLDELAKRAEAAMQQQTQ